MNPPDPIYDAFGIYPNAQDIEPGQFPGSTIRMEEHPRLVGGFPGPLASDDNGAIRPITPAEIIAGKQ